MAKRQCDYCKGDHTETKCPHLEGWMAHFINIINLNRTNRYPNLSLDLGTAFDLYELGTLWDRFQSSATQADFLGKTHWAWWSMVRSYKKRLNYKKAGEQRRGQKRTRSVRCGYCGFTGHTRRTCSDYKSHVATLKSDTTLRRAMFIDACREIGLGKGTLLKFTLSKEGREYRDNGWLKGAEDQFLAMVMEIPVANINAFTNSNRWSDFYESAHILCKPLTSTENRGTVSLFANNSVFNGAFAKITEQNHNPHYNSLWEVEIVSASKDQSWNEAAADDYLDILKKREKSIVRSYVEGASQWLEQNR